MGKLPFLLLYLSPQNRGGGRRAGDGPGPATWGLVGARGVGKRVRAARGVDSQPRLERRWPVGAWPRRRAAAMVVAPLGA